MAHRLIFVDPQQLFDSATLSASSEAAEHLVGNLQDQRPGRTWRSTSATAANTKITIDYATPQVINALCISHHNASTGATLRLYGSTTGAWAGEEVEVTSGATDMREPDYGYGEGPYGYGGYGGYLTKADFPDYVPIFYAQFDSNPTYRYWQLRITDTANTDAYFQIGRMALGNYFEPAHAHYWGYQASVGDISSVGRTGQGSFYSSALAKYQMVGRIEHICTIQDWEDFWLPLVLRKGLTRDMYILMDESPGAEQRHVMRRHYGRFVQGAMPSWTSGNIGRISYGIEQAL